MDGINAKYINYAVTLTDRDVIYSRTGQSDRGGQCNPEQATGIRLMGAGSSIKNSVVSFSSSMGIVLGENCTAFNNLVHDIDYEGSYASAIAPYNGANGQKILNNIMYRTGRSCIDMLDSKNMEIGYNDMYHFGMLNVDMGAVYSARGTLQTGSRIHHNWIHDSKSILDSDGGNGIQVGIYFDQETGGVQVDHNVLWNNLQADYYVEHGSGKNPNVSYIYNNTFATTDVGRSYLNAHKQDAIGPYTQDVIKNNIFREQFQINRRESAPSGTNSLYRTQDLLFVNEGTGGLKYRIRSNSLARDAGAVIPGVTDGYVGRAPDIGAYEYGGTDWVPGYTPPEKRSSPAEK